MIQMPVNDEFTGIFITTWFKNGFLFWLKRQKMTKSKGQPVDYVNFKPADVKKQKARIGQSAQRSFKLENLLLTVIISKSTFQFKINSCSYEFPCPIWQSNYKYHEFYTSHAAISNSLKSNYYIC